MTRSILVVPGDGVGPEVTAAAVRVLEATGADLELVPGEAGRGVQERHGAPVHPDTLAVLGDVDAVLFGATTTVPGSPSAVLTLRRALGLHTTVRPAQSIAGLGVAGCDVTVVRELTEDLYVQEERDIDGGAEATSRITDAATRRTVRVALDVAQRTRARRFTIAHKATVLPRTQGTFLRAASEEAAARGVPATPRLADSLAHDLVRDPAGPHVIVAPNLFGDVLSDVASALAGGLGLAPSASYGDAAAGFFEPVHGSAPDIAGRGVANPSAAILSGALLLDHLGVAHTVPAAVARALADAAVSTPDVGGSGTTRTFTDAVVAHLAAEVVTQ